MKRAILNAINYPFRRIRFEWLKWRWMRSIKYLVQHGTVRDMHDVAAALKGNEQVQSRQDSDNAAVPIINAVINALEHHAEELVLTRCWSWRVNVRGK